MADGAPAPDARAAREVTLTLPAGARVRWTFDHLLMPTGQALRQRIAVSRNRTRVADVYVTP